MGQLAQTFGKQIKALRAERGLTQAQLADLSGISEEWVRRIERGEGSPSLDTIEMLAQSLGVAVAALFGGTATSLRSLRASCAYWARWRARSLIG